MNSESDAGNSSTLIWEKVSSGDEKIPRLKSGDGDDDASGYSSSSSSSSVISSPDEIEKMKAEKRSKSAKRTRRKSTRKSASKSAQARSIMWWVLLHISVDLSLAQLELKPCFP